MFTNKGKEEKENSIHDISDQKSRMKELSNPATGMV
jgi:hypothetical protein